MVHQAVRSATLLIDIWHESSSESDSTYVHPSLVSQGPGLEDTAPVGSCHLKEVLDGKVAVPFLACTPKYGHNTPGAQCWKWECKMGQNRKNVITL